MQFEPLTNCISDAVARTEKPICFNSAMELDQDNVFQSTFRGR